MENVLFVTRVFAKKKKNEQIAFWIFKTEYMMNLYYVLYNFIYDLM